MKNKIIPKDKTYKLKEGTRVRKEEFGLLFYDSRIPQLIFVPSGRWIEPDFFSGKLSLLAWVKDQFSGLTEYQALWAQEKLKIILNKLNQVK